MAEQEAGEGESLRRAQRVRDYVQARLDLQFEQSDRLDRRLGTSLGFSGGLVALFATGLVVAFNTSGANEAIWASFEIGVLAAALLFLAHALTAGCALAFLSDLSPGAEVDLLIETDSLAETEEELVWWEIDTIRSAIERNRRLLLRKGAAVAVSLALTVSTAAAIAISIAAAAPR